MMIDVWQMWLKDELQVAYNSKKKGFKGTATKRIQSKL